MSHDRNSQQGHQYFCTILNEIEFFIISVDHFRQRLTYTWTVVNHIFKLYWVNSINRPTVYLYGCTKSVYIHILYRLLEIAIDVEISQENSTFLFKSAGSPNCFSLLAGILCIHLERCPFLFWSCDLDRIERSPKTINRWVEYGFTII